MFGLKTNLYQWLILHCDYWTSFHILQNSFEMKRKEKTEKRKEKQKRKRKREKGPRQLGLSATVPAQPARRRPLPRTAPPMAAVEHLAHTRARAQAPLPRGRQRAAAT